MDVSSRRCDPGDLPVLSLNHIRQVLTDRGVGVIFFKSWKSSEGSTQVPDANPEAVAIVHRLFLTTLETRPDTRGVKSA
jgi:hypothetical protein